MKKQYKLMIWWFAILTLGGYHVQYLEYRSLFTCESMHSLYVRVLGHHRVSDCVPLKGEESITVPFHSKEREGV